MKQINKIFLIAALFFMPILSSFSQSAGDYMSNMSTEFTKIKNDLFDYVTQVAHGKSARKANAKRQEVISTIKTARAKVSKMKGFNNNTTYRDSVLAYLNIAYNVLTIDYSKVIDLESTSNGSYDLMVAYMDAQEEASMKLNNAGDIVTRSQARFAEENGITINHDEDPKTRIIKIGSKVFKYKNRLDLLVFKNSFEEQKMLKALSAKDLNAVEESRNNLIAYSKESLKILDTMPPYNGEGAPASACRNLLAFYQNEAATQMTTMIAFGPISDDYHKAEKAYESKPKSSITQQDVDRINASSKKYNDAINAYNSKIDALNAKRSQLTEAYNNTCAAFLDKQVPKK